MMSELHGIVTLDEKSMERLRSEIYDEVMKDIEKHGCYYDQAKLFMEKCTWKEYCNIISDTISIAFAKSKSDNSTWHSDNENRKFLGIIDLLVNGYKQEGT